MRCSEAAGPAGGLPHASCGSTPVSRREFLLQKMKGLLELTVRSAANLPAADVSGGAAAAAPLLQVFAFSWSALLCLLATARPATAHTSTPGLTAPPSSPFPPPPVLGPPPQLWPGKSDPYCIIQIGDSSATTKVIRNTLDPVWDETFYLYIR